MANLSITNTLVNGNTVLASEHNTNYSDISTYINNRNAGTTAWDALYSESSSNVPLTCNNSSGTQNIADFQDNGSTTVIIKDGGNVGLGTASPFTQLANSATNYLPGNTGTGTESILWRSSVVGYVAAFVNDNTSTSAAGGVIIDTKNTTEDTDPEDNAVLLCLSDDSTRFIVTAAGKLGVGTNDPFTALANSGTNYTVGSNTGAGTNAILWRQNAVGYTAIFANDSNETTASAGVAINVINTTNDTDPEDNAALAVLTGSTMRFMVAASGQVAVGTVDPNVSALLHMVSTTQGFVPPVMSTTQRDAIGTPASGLIVYNSTTNKINVYTGSGWEAVTSA